MCGIYGMVSLARRPLSHPHILVRMARSLRHRGPDHTGILEGHDAAIGVERLRIIDPRPNADQPFRDGSGSRWMACNGEIYNTRELRRLYPGYRYCSRSDVEPLLPLLAARGPAGLRSVTGMFSIALWDGEHGTLTLARDPAGEKPLFYLQTRDEVWFASEVQALSLHPAASPALDARAVNEYLALGYVREPLTMYRDVRKVPAGTALTFRHDGGPVPESIDIDPPPSAVFDPSVDDRYVCQSLLREAVAKQVIADVPVGVFVSGGVDSSLIAALAAEHREGKPIYSFTVRFDDRSYDEGSYGRRLAGHIGSRHREVWADLRALGDALAEVAERLAEPLADPAILPTLLLARAAKEEVGVVLSGEGADELFGGYPTYLGHAFADRYTRLPSGIRRTFLAAVAPMASSPRRVPLAFLLQRFAGHADRQWLPRHLNWFGTGLFPFLQAEAQAQVVQSLQPANPAPHPVEAAMTLDYATYLRDGLLVKLDRSTMLCSLEARAPFLDPAVVSFASTLPRSRKVNGFHTKMLLREVARDMLPPWVAARGKRGLSVPIGAWINGALRTEVDRLLDPHRLQEQGVLPPLPIRQLLSEHRAGKHNHARALWTLFIFQHWLERWVLEGTR